jgi:hypothetical protein
MGGRLCPAFTRADERAQLTAIMSQQDQAYVQRKFRLSIGDLPPECDPAKSEQSGTSAYFKLFAFGKFTGKQLILWCPEGDLNPHGLAACGF